MKKVILFSMISCFVNSGSLAISFPVLKLNTSTRADALGSSYAALGNEIDGIYYNPSTIKEIKTNEIFTSYSSKLEGISYAYLSYGFLIDKQNPLGISLGILDGGNIEINYFDGSSVNKNAQRDYLISVCYGLALARDLNTGINLKFLYSVLAEEYKATVLLVDLGMKYYMFENIILAVSTLNLGFPAKYLNETDSVPVTFLIGIAYPINLFTSKASPSDVINLSTDTEIILTERTKVNVGVEYIYQNLISIRAGYRFNKDTGSITAGTGVKYHFEGIGTVGLDYAYIYGNDWFDTHKVSLIFKF